MNDPKLDCSFTDHSERTWEIGFTVGSINKLAVFYNCEPNDLIQKKFAELLVGGSYVDLAVLMYALLKDQARDFGMSETQFLDLFTPDDLELAAGALENAITAFTRPAQRTALTESLKRVREIQMESTEASVEMLNDPQLKKELLAKMQSGFKQNLSQLGVSPGVGGQGV